MATFRGIKISSLWRSCVRLCFNTLTPPVGIGEYIARLKRLLADLRTGVCDERNLIGAAIEAGKILSRP